MLKQCFPFWINEHPSLDKPIFKCLLILINAPGSWQSNWSLTLLKTCSPCSKHANTGPCHHQLAILLPSLRSTSIKNIGSLVNTTGWMSITSSHLFNPDYACYWRNHIFTLEFSSSLIQIIHMHIIESAKHYCSIICQQIWCLYYSNTMSLQKISKFYKLGNFYAIF